MRSHWRPQFLALLLLLLALTLPGNGNEGSSAGSCRCDKTFTSKDPPTLQQMEQLQKRVKDHHQCTPFVRRFQLPQKTVCGGIRDPWVIKLISCFERKECGHAYSGGVAHQEHLPPPSSSQVPESTERAPAVTGISVQTYLPPTWQSTQQPTLPRGALFLDKKLIHANETTTSSVGHSLEAGPEAGEKQQLEENVGPTAGTSPMVAVLSLLAISFILTAVLLYMLCKSKKSRQCSADWQL